MRGPKNGGLVSDPRKKPAVGSSNGKVSTTAAGVVSILWGPGAGLPMRYPSRLRYPKPQKKRQWLGGLFGLGVVGRASNGTGPDGAQISTS